jgi:SAM-dependent methyltransferase
VIRPSAEDAVRQLRDTRDAFDSVAADYDGALGNNALVQRFRSRTIAAVTQSARPGAVLLDLGCGTGIDAITLGRRGYRITAIDLSLDMIRRTSERAAAAGLERFVQARQLGLHELDALPAAAFDCAYSNLGPLNCATDLLAAARSIARRLRPGGFLVASVIGRVSPWELALFGLKGRWSRARVRWTRAAVAVPLNGHTVWTRYYSPRELRATFAAAGFRPHWQRGMGLLVPPPYMAAFAERHPALVSWLGAVEDRVATWPGLREWGDHFLVVLRRDG